MADDLLVPGSFWLQGEGRYLFASGTSQILAGGFAGIPEVKDHIRHAWGYQLSGGAALNNFKDWDFRLAYTGIRGSHSQHLSTHTANGHVPLPTAKGGFRSTSTFTKVTLDTSLKQHFDIGDFDIGHNVGLGGGNLRLFAGIRGVSFGQKSSVNLAFTNAGSPVASLNVNGQSNSWGVGPRIGASGMLPLFEFAGGRVSLVGEVGGSALFGQVSRHETLTDSFGFVQNFEAPHGSSFFNTDGALGVAFSLPLGSTEATITAGYRGEAWWGVLNTQTSNFLTNGRTTPGGPVAGTKSGDQYFNGPFASLKIRF